ncbi:DUF4062 domain-containing protein [Streptomyces agglomeratus]|uniref:DUF4062 domain-containing protein n=1 Tax=Streptomyces agglomeratus TaxID=285458 RepID=UPI000A54DC62|nr:DUF4062 domain-containing protein [Streptomyces agglomeratus]
MVAADKRYQVFVSSTYLDLKEERRAIISTLLNLDAIPAGMEIFPAVDADAWNLIKQVIDDCDYYLLVIGGKYGSIDPNCDLSYTEKEYDYAASIKKPIMAFLYGDVEKLPGKKLELDSGIANKLKEFREKVKQGKHVKYWTSADHLAGQVAVSFPSQIKLFPAIGWVRADKIASVESLQEIETLRKRISELENQLGVAAHNPPPGTSELQSGSDPTSLNIEARFRYATGGVVARGSLATARDFTWDGIFSMVGPSLLGECEQEQMHDAINDWITDHLWEGIYSNELANAFDEADLNLEDQEITEYSLSIPPEDFHNILVQFLALGLIEKGDRKRPIADRNIYWKLTPYGQTRTLQLKAKKKS